MLVAFPFVTVTRLVNASLLLFSQHLVLVLLRQCIPILIVPSVYGSVRHLYTIEVFWHITCQKFQFSILPDLLLSGDRQCFQDVLFSFLKITCLHVSFTAYENFYRLSKMHFHLVLTFHFLKFRMSEYKNPTIKHISTYTLVSSSITTYVTDLFLGSNPHSKIPF